MALLEILGLSHEEPHNVYLDLPSFVGRDKRKVFSSIRERIWKKLQTWKGILFSVGGREVLIKAVAQATSTYAMSVFQIPSSLCDDIRSLITRIWWGGDCDDRKIH